MSRASSTAQVQSPFEEKLLFFLSMELRRQGVVQAQASEWQNTVQNRMRLTSSSSSAFPSGSSSDPHRGGAAKATTSKTAHAQSSPPTASDNGDEGVCDVFELHLDGLPLGDRVTIAVCEVLMKLSTAAMELQCRPMAEWRLGLRGCGIGDRCVRHLELLLQTCTRLSWLDVAGNAFSEEGWQTLQTVVSELEHPCDVILFAEGAAEATEEEEDGIAASSLASRPDAGSVVQHPNRDAAFSAANGTPIPTALAGGVVSGDGRFEREATTQNPSRAHRAVEPKRGGEDENEQQQDDDDDEGPLAIRQFRRLSSLTNTSDPSSSLRQKAAKGGGNSGGRGGRGDEAVLTSADAFRGGGGMTSLSVSTSVPLTTAAQSTAVRADVAAAISATSTSHVTTLNTASDSHAEAVVPQQSVAANAPQPSSLAPTTASASGQPVQQSGPVRSPSTQSAATQRSYASGSAEALRRRREELFGRSPPTSQKEHSLKMEPLRETGSGVMSERENRQRPFREAAMAASSVPPPPPPPQREGHMATAGAYDDVAQVKQRKPTQAVSARRSTSPGAAREGIEQSDAHRQRTPSPPTSTGPAFTSHAIAGGASRMAVSDESPPPRAVAGAAAASAEAHVNDDGDGRGGGGSHSPFRDEPSSMAGPVSSITDEERLARNELRRFPPQRVSSARPVDSATGEVHSDVNDDDSDTAHSEEHAEATARRRREPFPADRTDQLDVTANLNPLLDSVLDLSGVVRGDGQLRQAHIFGGARSLWEVIEAYEEAVEQSFQGSAVDPNTSAKLPSALIGGGSYNALTVLNISNNHLRELHVLPPTLLRLDVSSNELTQLNGLHRCKMLTVLNARRNAITAISGLERNGCVAHLFLGHNNIRVVEGLAHLLLLETLDLTFNRLRTQGSIRALSLCSGLRHLLLKGNPVVDTMKGNSFRPILRNLCPTLLVIDDAKIGPSRFADSVQSDKNWLRHPQMIDTTPNQQRRQASSRHGGPAVADRFDVNSSTVMPGSGGGGLRSSHLQPQSRRRPDDASSFAATTSIANGNASAAVDGVQQSMNLLHLLTRGVTAPTGYGDSANAAHAAKVMARRREEQARAAQEKRARAVTEGGKPLRLERMKQLAEESKRYLETTLVDRMTSASAMMASPDTSQGVHYNGGEYSVEEEERDSVSGAAHGGSPTPTAPARAPHTAGPQPPHRVVSPSLTPSEKDLHASRRSAARGGAKGGTGLEDSPIAEVMGYDNPPPQQQHNPRVAAEVLRGYAPRKQMTRPTAPKAKQSKSPPPPSQQQQQQPRGARTSPPATAFSTRSQSQPSERPQHFRGEAVHRPVRGFGGVPRHAQLTANVGAGKGNDEDYYEPYESFQEGGGGEAPGQVLNRPALHGYPNAHHAVTAAEEEVEEELRKWRAQYAAAHRSSSRPTPSPPATSDRPSPVETQAPHSVSSRTYPAHPSRSLSAGERRAASRADPVRRSPLRHSRSRDPPLPRCYGAEDDATLEAIYVEAAPHEKRGRGVSKDAHREAMGEASDEYDAAAEGGSSSYAALYAAARRREPSPPTSAAHTRAGSAGETRGRRPATSSSASPRFNVALDAVSDVEHRSAAPSVSTAASVAAVEPTYAPPPPMRTLPQSTSPTTAHVARDGGGGGSRSGPRTAASLPRSSQRRTSPSQPSPTASATPPSSSSVHALSVALPLPREARSNVYEPPSAPVPLRVGEQQRNRVEKWARQLSEDTEAVQAALKTTALLLKAQRQRDMAVPESSRELPPTYLEERRKCAEIIGESGMLHDTHVPMEVVVYYGYSKAELEGQPEDTRHGGHRLDVRMSATAAADEEEREEVLRQVRLLGDTKTCLRYLLLLMSEEKEGLLQQYVDQLGESFA